MRSCPGSIGPSVRRFAGVFLWVLIAPGAGARAGAFTEIDGKEWVMEAEGSGSGTEDRPAHCLGVLARCKRQTVCSSQQLEDCFPAPVTSRLKQLDGSHLGSVRVC